MAFANGKKIKLVAGFVASKLIYLKKSKSYFPQSEIKGKKYGMEMDGYLPDPGTTKHGIVADPDSINQPKIAAVMDNMNTSCELDLWDELVEVESFVDEIAKPRGINLALSVQKEVMELNMCRSAQAVVVTSAGFPLLTKAAKALDALEVGGSKVCFQDPDILGTIAESGLSRFIPSDRMKEIYEDAYLGQYSGAAQVEIANTPIINTTGMDAAPTISAQVIKDSNNNVIGLKPIKTVTGSGTGSLIAGVPYKVSGLKIRAASGIESDKDYIVIYNKELTGVDDNKNPVYGYGIPELRLTVKGKGTNNANAWMEHNTLTGALSGDVATFTLTPLLTAGKKYAVGQCRTQDCLGYDQYKFGNLPGSDDSDVATVDGVTVKMMQFGDGKNGVKLIRLDMTFCAKLYDHRESVTTYTLLGDA